MTDQYRSVAPTPAQKIIASQLNVENSGRSPEDPSRTRPKRLTASHTRKATAPVPYQRYSTPKFCVITSNTRVIAAAALSWNAKIGTQASAIVATVVRNIVQSVRSPGSGFEIAATLDVIQA